MAKKKKKLKENFYKFMSIFLIILMLSGVVIPAIIVIIDVIAGQ